MSVITTHIAIDLHDWIAQQLAAGWQVRIGTRAGRSVLICSK